MKKTEKILSFAIPAAILCGFVAFALLSPRADAVTVGSGAISVILLTLICLRGLPRFLDFIIKPDEPPHFETLGERSRRRLHPTFKLMLLSLVMQLVLILAIYAVSNSVNGFSGTVFERYPLLFMGSNYYGLGEHANDAIQRFALLPIIPVINSLLGELTERTVLIAFLFNTLCLCGASAMLHRLMLFDHNRRTAFASVLMLHISPSVIFLLMPRSGAAPFLLLALVSLYFLRCKCISLSGLFCALAIYTNVLGLPLLIPILINAVKAVTLCCASTKPGSGDASPVKGSSKSRSAIFDAVVGILIPLAAIAVSFVLRRLIPRSVSLDELFRSGFRFVFEIPGMLIANWSASLESPNAMFAAILAYIGFGLMAMRTAKHMYTPFTVLTLLWYTLVPAAVGSPTMLIYALCLCPTLPEMISSCLNGRLARVSYAVVLLAALLVFTSVIFVRSA